MKNKDEVNKIYESCNRVYGTCTDGSFEMCLSVNGYYQLAKDIKEESLLSLPVISQDCQIIKAANL